MKILSINTGLTKILIVLTILLVPAGSLLAGGKGGGKGGGKTTTPFIDGFYDSRTPGVLCAWEQLNACEGRKEVFVVSETKKANGTNYYLDYDEAVGDTWVIRYIHQVKLGHRFSQIFGFL